MRVSVFRTAALVVAGFLAPQLRALSAQIYITPNSNSGYPVGWQLEVGVQICITNPDEHFYSPATITQNENLVGYASGQLPPPGCVEFQSASIPITLVDGANNVTVTVQTFIGSNPDVINTWSDSRLYSTPPPPPFIDLSIHNGHNRNIATCEMACFDNTTSYTTPAYWTLDAARAATLFYSSGQVESRHIVEFQASTPAAVPVGQLIVKLRRPDLSFVTLTNGMTSMSFAPPDNDLHRYAIQFEDSTLSTGAYNYTLILTAVWPGASTEAAAPIRLLVINERISPYGAGWSVAGIGRVIVGPNDSVVTYDGAGSIQFWGAPTNCANWTCTYTSPPGEFDQLKRVTNSSNTAEQWYYRTTVDGIKLTFYSFGAIRLSSIQDPFLNTITFTWKPDYVRIDTITDPVGKKIAFTYDGSNRLNTIRDVPGNRTTTFTVNAQNNLTQIQDAIGGKPFQQATYDSFHRLLSQVNRRGDRWASGYDVAGKLAVDSTPPITADTTSGIEDSHVFRSLVTTYRSPQAAGLAAIDSGGIGVITPPVGSVRQTRTDAYGALLEVLAPLSEYALYQRNQHGQIFHAYDSTGHHYLTWSGPRLMQDSNVSTSKLVKFDWNTATNRITRRYGNGTVEQHYFYDATGYRLDSTKVTNQPASRFTYDTRGRVVSIIDPRSHAINAFYDGNTWFNTDSTKSGSRRTWLRYDAVAGRVSNVHKPGGRVDSTFYDALNRVTRTAGPLGDSTRYTYGDSLDLTKITDELGHVTRVEKNALGWDTLAIDAANATQRYEYSRMGQVKRLTNRRGQVTRFVYDNIGRLTSRILADNRITNFSFGDLEVTSSNSEGTDTTRLSGNGTTSDEIATRGSYTFTVRTVYDTSSKDLIVRLSPPPFPPDFEVRYDLDSAGRTQRILLDIDSFNARPDTLTYVSDFLMTGLRLHGAASISYQSRAGHDLARMVYTPSALQTSFGTGFVQDTASRTVQQIDGNGAEYENYSYDVRGRLTGFSRYAASPPCSPTDTLSEFGTACATGTIVLGSDTFTYDAAGNRTDKNAVINGAGRLTQFNGDGLLYDADGNLQRRYRLTDSLIFNQRLYWNSINQLDSVRTTRSGSTQSVRFGYDGMGRRVRKTVGTVTTYYVFSGSRVIGEYTGSGGFIRAYAYQPGLDHPHAVYQGGAWHYYVTDGSDNVRGLVNSAATVVEAEYEYLPHGDTVSTAGSLVNNIRFAGREYDSETGLYYVRARYYDPSSGRFITEDAGSLLGRNRYTYAANNPVNQGDPTGRDCKWEAGQRQESPPVGAFGSTIFEVEDGTIVCDDDGGGAGSWSAWVEGEYWNQLFYDPLFFNGGLPLVDFTPIDVSGIGVIDPKYASFQVSGFDKCLGEVKGIRQRGRITLIIGDGKSERREVFDGQVSFKVTTNSPGGYIPAPGMGKIARYDGHLQAWDQTNTIRWTGNVRGVADCEGGNATLNRVPGPLKS
jgi:RHS repeat-associated protein